MTNTWASNFFFDGVEYLNCFFKTELVPACNIGPSSIEFFFQGSNSSDIKANGLWCQVLDEDHIGRKLKYGKQQIFDSGGFLKPIQEEEIP